MASDLFDSAIGKPELQQSQNVRSPWGPQQESLRDLFGSARGIYFGGGQTPSPLTSQAWQMAANTAQDPNSLTGQAGRQLGDTISGKYLDPNTNPYLSGAVNDALGLAKSQFLGLYGGPAGQNINNTGFQEQLARTLANTALPAYSNAYNQERQNQLNALTKAPAFDYATPDKLAQIGGMQEAFPWQQLSRYQSAVTGDYGGVYDMQSPWNSQLFNRMFPVENTVSGPQGLNPMIGSVAGAAGSFFSDVRLKENIERIGTHDSGIGIYKYTYKGSDVPQIGVLAQEVEQVMPEAVGEVAGFKTVSYKMI